MISYRNRLEAWRFSLVPFSLRSSRTWLEIYWSAIYQLLFSRLSSNLEQHWRVAVQFAEIGTATWQSMLCPYHKHGSLESNWEVCISCSWYYVDRLWVTVVYEWSLDGKHKVYFLAQYNQYFLFDLADPVCFFHLPIIWHYSIDLLLLGVQNNSSCFVVVNNAFILE